MPALPVIIPLLLAAFLGATGNLLPRRLLDILATAAAGTVTLICCLLCTQTNGGTLVYWFGGWKPMHGFPVGICFAIDPINAGMAALVALLVTAAFTFSWGYFESIKSFYHALMLVFMAAMCGLCLTGDLFNLFVWFELMTAAAVGLCGYKSEESWPLLGALNFAVTNTIGAFISLTGIAILYAYTGSLNMSEVGHALATHPISPTFTTIALLMLCTGFLVKAAAFPFHFWLADAHAVAPTPVCILLSGVMVELGIYAVGWLLWSVFSISLAAQLPAIGDVLLLIGCMTAVVGAVYCYSQRHFKRLLAFSTISHVGIMFIALGLLDAKALGGVAIYIIGHAMVKGSLFICAGIFLHRFHSVDEHDLRGSGREIWPVAILMLLGAWGLAGLPPMATFDGQSLIDQAAAHAHRQWATWFILFAEIITAGAVVRATARIFMGWGKLQESTCHGAPHIPMDPETKGQSLHVPACMWAPAAVLLLGAMIVPSFLHVTHAAVEFADARAYQSSVLEGPSLAPAFTEAFHPRLNWHQIIVVIGTSLIAAWALFPDIFGKSAHRFLTTLILRIVRPLRAMQSGRIGDYVAWLVFGLAAYGGILLFIERLI